MWELARPLIENWMIENMGPEAKIREATETILDGLERLPALIADMEMTVSAAARDGVRVNPASLQTLSGAGSSGGWKIWAAAAAVAGVVIALVD